MNDDEDRYISNHMEEIFNIDEESTAKPPAIKKYEVTENCNHELYNEKDREIEDQIQAIYDASMETFHDNIETSRDINPKFKARHDEVNIQYLNTALAAVREKAALKNNKEKLQVSANKNNQNTTNVIIDRNDLLKMMSKNEERDITPSEVQSIESDDE